MVYEITGYYMQQGTILAPPVLKYNQRREYRPDLELVTNCGGRPDQWHDLMVLFDAEGCMLVAYKHENPNF